MGASFLIDLITYLSVGPLKEAPQIWGIVLRLRMLVPALTAAMLLMARTPHKVTVQGRIFFVAFLSMVAVPLALIALGYRTVGSAVQRLLTVLLTAYIFVLHAKPGWKSTVAPLRLGFARNTLSFLRILVLYLVLLALSFGLNPAFGLSESVPGGSLGDLLISLATILAMLILFGWVSYFGEEYGWRYYLQERLCAILGPRRGVLILGVIWGLWHAPIIAMGYNYAGQPFLGVLAMVSFTVVVGIYFSYVVMHTGSIWPAVILHGVTNTLAPRFMRYFGQAEDSVFSFGLGLYGIALFALPAVFLLVAFKDVYRPTPWSPDQGQD